MFIRQRTEWTVIDKSLQADFDALRKVCDGDFDIDSRDLADKTWIVSYVVDNAPGFDLCLRPRQQEGDISLQRPPGS